MVGDEEWIAKQIDYPDSWDTLAYPTLVSALWELVDPVNVSSYYRRESK